MRDLIVHQVNISNYRLVELTKLVDQYKPFYDWVEKRAKEVTGSHKLLNDILMESSVEQLKALISACYSYRGDNRPLLFDGIGRVYNHQRACFYFFAWIIRDAPQQRLTPLLMRMRQLEKISNVTAQIDSLAELIHEYRGIVKGFEWLTVREVFIDRLEGSRRSIRGHRLEALVRTSFVTAIQNYYSINNSYGKFERVDIAEKQAKIGNHTVDVSARLVPKNKRELPVQILMPIKTRETEGGGHAHIFSRDILTAIRDLKSTSLGCRIVVVIVAKNWSVAEIGNIDGQIDLIFHFAMSPYHFQGFDDESQVVLNQFIREVLDG
jgi:hypothetical protein